MNRADRQEHATDDAAEMADGEIVRHVLAGDREAFRHFVARYQTRVFRAVARVVRDREEAEDAAQEVFLKAYTNLSRYDSRWRFSTWLMTIATRTAINTLRNRSSRQLGATLDGDAPDRFASPLPNPAEEAKGKEWLDRLRREIAALNERMRVIFGLRYEDRMSISEIARATQSSEVSVRVALHRARQILRKKLQDLSDG